MTPPGLARWARVAGASTLILLSLLTATPRVPREAPGKGSDRGSESGSPPHGARAAERDGAAARGTIDARPTGVWAALPDAALREDYVGALAATAKQLHDLAATRGPRDPETLRALHEAAFVGHLGGDQDTAEESAELALALREQVHGPSDHRTIESLILRGLIAKYANDIPLAERCYARALTGLSGPDGDLSLIADALVGRAHLVRVNHGAPGKAVKLLEQARSLRVRAGESAGIGLADNLVWLGWSLLNEGRHEEARSVLAEAQKVLEASGLRDHSLMGTTLTCLADLHVLRRDWTGAESLYRRGLSILERSRRGYLPGFSLRKLSLRGYDDLAAVQLRHGSGEDAWRSLQRLRNNVSLDLASLSRWRTIDPAGYARARALRLRLDALRSNAAGPKNGISDSARVIRLSQRLETLAALLRLERDYLLRARPGEAGPDEIRRALPPRTAYIGWLHSRLGNRVGQSRGAVLESAWIAILRPDAPVRWVPLWEARTSEDVQRRTEPHMLCHLRYQQASEWPLRVADDPDLDRAAHDVWKAWLAPAMPYLQGIDHLIVEYSFEFPRVPIESLPDGTGRYLGDRFACTYVPSATTHLWLARDARRPPASNRPALAVGGAVFAAHAETPAMSPHVSTVLDPVLVRKALSGDPDTLDRLPTLPYSLDEARTVASLFPGSQLLTGADASEHRLGELARSGRLAQFGVVHLATHVLSECHPERSAFALSRLDLDGTSASDGLLRSREVLDSWSLDADLLVLSGCQSARSCGWDDGEYVGFTQALMAVGARSVLASLWKVDDQATALLMRRFYENLTGGAHGEAPARARPRLPKDLALCEAKRWLRDQQASDGSRPYAHPVYWSGFVLIGPGD